MIVQEQLGLSHAAIVVQTDSVYVTNPTYTKKKNKELYPNNFVSLAWYNSYQTVVHVDVFVYIVLSDIKTKV